MQAIRKIFGNVYIQTLLALIFTIITVILLGNLLFRHNASSTLQMASIIGIGITLFLFFSFTLWKVNQQKQWVSRWANHPILVLLTFTTLPILLIFLANISIFQNSGIEELLIKQGKYFIPHFMFFYFWEALIFGIAFLAHPERKTINWHISKKDLLISLLLSLGLWSVIMLLNEIQLQWIITPINYLEPQTFFWPVIPLAIFIVPIALSYFFFYRTSNHTLFQKLALLFVFSLLPLRLICIFPALIIGLTFFLSKKELPYTTIVLTYTFFNLFTLLLNWNWVI